MAELWVRIGDFEDGVFPPTCASSGATPAPLRRVRASYQPGWPLAFVLLGPVGLLTAFVAMVGLTRNVDGWLPRSHAVIERGYRSRRAALTTAGAAGATALFAAFALGSLGTRPAALVIGTVGAVTVIAALWRAGHPAGHITARLAANGRRVRLRNVDPGFAAAYDEQDRWRRTHRNDSLA